jgi:serine/threonine protein kinase
MGNLITKRSRHQYRTGKTLGSGTYAIVKEAVHIKTGKYYACKVINKKLMEGREFMVRPCPILPRHTL